MDVILGALPNLLPKLGELLVGEYKLQKGMKGEIRFIQAELQSMKGALEKISSTPRDQLDNQDKIWAMDVRELSYDIEDSVDAFMVHGKGSELTGPRGFKIFIDRCYDLLTQFQVRRSIATEIRDIKRRVIEVSERRDRYKIDTATAKPVTIDPRVFVQYKNVTELVGIDEARDEVIKILMEGNEVYRKEDKIISIVGFGGLGKTTLANMVYGKLTAQFDCTAFVSVSQTPGMDKIFKDMLYQLSDRCIAGVNVINELKEFLKQKRYLIVTDDIWDIAVWKMIKCSLPDNNTGCYIITTTRILSVAEQVGIAYKLRPLSLQNSRKLLYRRIFGNKKKIKNEDPEKYPDDELTEVSNNILKKCGGVPLALITIASLLASKGINKIEWYEVYNSVGTGLENSFDLANMRKILSFSYYDLPPHLRTCLLYLSIFPEDYNIGKDRLIWIWIAEGFIQREKQGKSLFELGEGYFNKLINRSMIQPVHNKDNGTIEYCRVHDMVLDFICSLSSEENFVTIYNNMDNISIIPNTVRSLSLQTDEIDHATCVRSMQQVRSVVVFPSAFKLQISVLESFRVLRVLDFIDCYLLQDCSLKCLGNLVHLRYLGLSNTSIAQLPEDIGNLRFLQTLDLRRNRILRLPSTIIDLKHLMCLRVDAWTTVPNGIGSLTSLEELSKLSIDSSMDIIEDMGHLTKLRVLNVDFLAEWNESIKNSLVESLSKLQKLRSIDISIFGECNLDAWVVPRRLCRFAAPTRRLGYWFSKLPYWMNPSLLHLAFLSITLRELQQKDLEILGRLPALRNLDLEVGEDIGICGRLFFTCSSFPCLIQCELHGFIGPVVFQKKTMPKLTNLRYMFPVREIAGINGYFDLGLKNLPSLENVTVWFRSGGASEEEVKEAASVLRHVVEVHPNHPRLVIPW